MIQTIKYPEIEYYKGEVYNADGSRSNRTYLTRKFIEESYIKAGMSFDQIKEHYKISYKIFYLSYKQWFSLQERKKIGGGKIAISQKNRNSNRFNAGKPRVLLQEKKLQEYISKKYAIEKMAFLEKVAPQTIKRNLEYYHITEEIVKYGIDYERVITASAIDNILGTNILKGIAQSNIDIDATEVDQALRDIREAHLRLEEMQNTLRRIRQSLIGKYSRRNKVPVNRYNIPTSRTNKLVYSILKELEYEPECEYNIKDRFYDFYIKELETLIEIDAEGYHITEDQLKNDIYKNNLAKDAGYKLLRITISKSDKRVTIKRKIEICINQLK
jgi:very-short-patch-repair endonuclease